MDTLYFYPAVQWTVLGQTPFTEDEQQQMAATWDQDHCFTEPELRKMASQGEIVDVTVQETMEGYIVVVTAKLPVLDEAKSRWIRKPTPAVWRTRRELDSPRVFNSLERLMERLATTFESIESVQLKMLSADERAKKIKAQPTDRRPGRPPGKKVGEKAAAPAVKAAKPRAKKQAHATK